MIDKRNKIIEKDKYVFECLSCGRKVIAKDRPETCTCSQPQWVINTQFIITK
jgi:DNA-directed RNA polymerase subunit RPC12/RpoP